jgi:Tat protein secretion system quality control protein TatD with DNase activity
VLDLIPSERLLTETDYPHTRRYDRAANRPGKVDIIETHLSRCWEIDRLEVRRRLWRNLGTVLTQGDVIDRMPRAIIAALATAGFDG